MQQYIKLKVIPINWKSFKNIIEIRGEGEEIDKSVDLITILRGFHDRHLIAL